MPKSKKASSEEESNKTKSMSTQERAGLSFPVRRTETRLRFKTRATITRVAGLTSVYVTGLVEKAIGHVLALAGEECARAQQKRISLVHIQEAVRGCPDLSRTFAGFAFATSLDVPKASKMVVTKAKIKEMEEKASLAKAAKEAAKSAMQATA